jgi:hypothetical protein
VCWCVGMPVGPFLGRPSCPFASSGSRLPWGGRWLPRGPEPASLGSRNSLPSRAEPSRAEPSRAEPSRAEPSRAEPSRAEPRNPRNLSLEFEKSTGISLESQKSIRTFSRLLNISGYFLGFLAPAGCSLGAQNSIQATKPEAEEIAFFCLRDFRPARNNFFDPFDYSASEQMLFGGVETK